MYGISALFYGECTVKDGAIEETNFDTYNSIRIAEMPKVESIVMPSGGSGAWGGVGEPTILVAAPAIMNAYFRATGKRIRSFPLKNHNLQIASRSLAVHRRRNCSRQPRLAPRRCCDFRRRCIAQGAGPPVVVIGGGFGGASCARALRKADPRIAVTLVEANATYTALPTATP